MFPTPEPCSRAREWGEGWGRSARHYGCAGMIGWDGQKMSKSRGNLVLVSALRAEGVEPAAIRLGLLAGHYRADRSWDSAVLEQAIARLAHWRAATALPTGPGATDVIARLRRFLAYVPTIPSARAALCTVAIL